MADSNKIDNIDMTDASQKLIMNYNYLSNNIFIIIFCNISL